MVQERSAPRRKPKALPKIDLKKGRPTVYQDSCVVLTFRLSLLGLTDEEQASVFDIDTSTLQRWDKEHPEFRDARADGRIKADAKVAASLWDRANGYSHPAVKIFMPAGADEPVYAEYMEHFPPDTNAAALWLSNRQRGRWKLKSNDEETNTNINIKIVGGLPDE